MTDPIVTFPVRSPLAEDLGVALGRCFAEFSAWYGQAMTVAGFAEDARAGGVKSILTDRLHQALEVGEKIGLFQFLPGKSKTNVEVAQLLADHQLGLADQGVKIAAIVMLHNAYERFLWRLVRFGLVGNREQALRWIARRSVPVESLIKEGVDAAVDAHLEKWWEELERDTLAAKWDRLTGLIGFPAKLNSPPWRFDRNMMVEFDDVRHNAVHNDAQAVKDFDLAEFAKQLWRAQLVWLVEIALILKITIPTETMFRSR
jgi:hypothetical protein